ncbi:MAG TPA: carboxylating nicotinate-nucleotide diphosphorylase [Planctomycetota bacterium]|nr:carboxylating nicotinate-nucleotide diphosphorylase [Planctomycetota bacterium]
MPTLKSIVSAALAEDIGRGDVTTEATVPASKRAIGRIVARQKAIVAGLDVAREVFKQVGATWRSRAKEGDPVRPGQGVAEVRGRTRSILGGERVALNFIQRLSGTATLTRAFVDAVKGTGAKILDTRKTTPGLRLLEKAAVRAGGGTNHRVRLDDAALIKDNHISATESVAAAVEQLRRRRGPRFRIEIEAQSRAQALAFAELDIDVLMLDNLSVPAMRRLVPEVRAIRPKLLIEASGGVTLETVRAIAETGVDWISVGALTHSAPAVDFSLDLA